MGFNGLPKAVERDDVGMCVECPHRKYLLAGEVCKVNVMDMNGNPLDVPVHVCHMESPVACAGHALSKKLKKSGRYTYTLDLINVRQEHGSEADQL